MRAPHAASTTGLTRSVPPVRRLARGVHVTDPGRCGTTKECDQMVDKNDTPTELDPAQSAGVAKRTRRRAASRPAVPPAAVVEAPV